MRRNLFTRFTPFIPIAVLLSFGIGLSFLDSWANREWYSSYEAYIIPEDYETIRIPCIADTYGNNKTCSILSLHFPFGHEQECEETLSAGRYDWVEADNMVRVRTDNDGFDVHIVLEHEATEQTWVKLDDLYSRNGGEAYADKAGDIFHINFSDVKCPHGKKIEPRNIVHFYDRRDAEIMGFQCCEWCRNNW